VARAGAGAGSTGAAGSADSAGGGTDRRGFRRTNFGASLVAGGTSASAEPGNTGAGGIAAPSTGGKGTGVGGTHWICSSPGSGEGTACTGAGGGVASLGFKRSFGGFSSLMEVVVNSFTPLRKQKDCFCPASPFTLPPQSPTALAPSMKRAAEKSPKAGSAAKISAPKAPAPSHEVSLTKTINAPVDRAFAAWKEPAAREKWLPRAALTVRKATPHKSIRILWRDGTTVSVNFWPKGSLKCQVVPHHGPFPSADAAAKMEAFWLERLEALRLFLEKK
jgi:hypothetical protein